MNESINFQRNDLDKASSPYLLQHKDNPIWWKEWSEETLLIAKNLNKPIFLSVGYATCHWCHVMEKDSFEKIDVADFLNKHFLSIKLDREERPDLDQFYMKILMSMQQGHGGWPMSLFLTPELKPFWAATFIPKDNFLWLLAKVQKLWESKEGRKELYLQADEIFFHTLKFESLEVKTKKESLSPLHEIEEKIFFSLQNAFDEKFGGFGFQPKFPEEIRLLFLQNSKNKKAKIILKKTLEIMSVSGIHDIVGGGFHRYATDQNWDMPHFEKMLYNQALLFSIFASAGVELNNPFFLNVSERIFSYVISKLYSHSNSLFYSAEDADSENMEGAFYLWKKEEIDLLLSKDIRVFAENYFFLPKEGNFNPPKSSLTIEEKAGYVHQKGVSVLSIKKEKISSEIFEDRKFKENFLDFTQTLNKNREKRPKPFLDNKSLMGINSLMSSALIKHSYIFSASLRQKMAETAKDNLDFFRNFLENNSYKNIPRGFKEKKPFGKAQLEDVSFLLASFLDFFKENPFEISFLEAAKSLCLFIEEEFLDVNDKSTSYFDSPKDSIGLLKRSKNTVDHVLPSPSAIHLLNLKKLSFYFLEKDPNFANICQKKAEGLYQTLLFDLHAAWQGKISSFLAVKEYEQLKFFLKINAPKNQYQEFQNFLIKENKWNPSSFVCTVSSNPHKKSSLSLCTDKLCLFECNFPMTDMQKKEILEII